MSNVGRQKYAIEVITMSNGIAEQSEEEKRKQQIEEYKELGQEYRYRDQMMVQEFGLSMVAIGVVVRLLWDQQVSLKVLVAKLIVLPFLFILAFHLDHINQDRRAALDRREELRKSLGFGEFHLGAGGRRISAPRMMIWFARLLLVGWVTWIALSACEYFHP
jgi:hypothetical protein